MSDPIVNLMRWRFWLVRFVSKVKYKKGRKNQQADALTCLLMNIETVRKDDVNEVFTLDFISLANQYE